jgi:hypothetical protein
LKRLGPKRDPPGKKKEKGAAKPADDRSAEDKARFDQVRSE